MSTIAMPPILCAGCQRKFAWKPELAGKKVKCKCGQSISVKHAPGTVAPVPAKPMAAKPAAPKPAPKPVKHVEPDEMGLGLDGLFALAEDAEKAAANAPIEIREVAPAAVAAPAVKRTTAAGGIPLAYKRTATAAQRNRPVESHIDPRRDLYAPLALIGVGLVIYIGFFVCSLNLGLGGTAVVGTGVVLLMILKTAMMIGAAFVLAGPLGVSFGGIGPAVLKLAAIAVFADGVTAWIDYGLSMGSAGVGGGGFFGFSMISWPISIMLYWIGMTYLFDMDFSDARLVTVCLGIFSRVVRIAIFLLVLPLVLSMAGIGSKAANAVGINTGAIGSAAADTMKETELTAKVNEMRDDGQLIEANKFIAGGAQRSLQPTVTAWYAAGAKNVYFEMSGADINGRRNPIGMVVQLPKRADQRAQCYKILKDHYVDQKMFYDPNDLKDTGESYMEVELRISM